MIREIEEVLDDEFCLSIYDNLIRWGLYDYRKKDYFKKLVSIVKLNKEDGFTGEFKEGNPIFDGYGFYNFIVLLNILNIDRDSEVLDGFTNISDYEKWLLKPLEYNYLNFNAKWVLASDNIYILKSLKGIKPLMNIVDTELKNEFNSKLSEIYYKYLS